MKTKHHAAFLNIEDSNAQLRAGQRIRVDVAHVHGVRWLVMVVWPNGSGTTDRVWFRWRATRQAARRRRELADLAPFVAPETP